MFLNIQILLKFNALYTSNTIHTSDEQTNDSKYNEYLNATLVNIA